MDVRKLAKQAFEAGFDEAWSAYERAAETVQPGGISESENLRFQIPVGTEITPQQASAIRAAYDQGVQIGVYLAWQEYPERGLPLVFSNAVRKYADGREEDIT